MAIRRAIMRRKPRRARNLELGNKGNTYARWFRNPDYVDSDAAQDAWAEGKKLQVACQATLDAYSDSG